MKISEIVASNIKQLRLAHNITQEEAAFRCDISPIHYKSIENCKADLDVDVLDKLSYGFDISPAELVGIYSTKHTLIFSCIESEFTSEDLVKIRTYGIKVETIMEGDIIPVMMCPNISTDKSKVLLFLSVLNRLQLSVGHIGDVVEDFLVE